MDHCLSLSLHSEYPPKKHVFGVDLDFYFGYFHYRAVEMKCHFEF